MPCFRSLVVLALWAAASPAGDWPQWLGPTRDGVSPETVLPWKAAAEVLWRQPVGEGHSSPVVVGGRVFLHTKLNGKDDEEVTAYDTASGKVLWRSPYPRAAFKSLFGNGPRATPAVSGDRLYALGITGVLTCLDVATGKQIWQVDTLQKFDAKNLFFGVSTSPLVDGRGVLVNVGGKGSVVAFDKDKGDVLWKSLDDRASYASPIRFQRDGREQVVFLTQQGLVSLNPADGSRYWQYPLVDKLLESSTTPVVVGDRLVGSSITYGTVALHLETRDGKPAVREAWKNPSLTCYFSTPIPVGTGQLYLVSGKLPLAGGKTEAALCCVDPATGKELWSRPRIGKYHAALIRTGNDKLLMLDDTSNLILLDPDPKEYRELARSPVAGETWAHPALANGRLYLRDGKELLCLQLGVP